MNTLLFTDLSAALALSARITHPLRLAADRESKRQEAIRAAKLRQQQEDARQCRAKISEAEKARIAAHKAQEDDRKRAAEDAWRAKERKLRAAEAASRASIEAERRKAVAFQNFLDRSDDRLL